MHGRDDDLRTLGAYRLAAVLRHAEGLAEEGLGGRGAEADDDLRFDEGDLEIEPGVAGGDLHGVRLLVNAPLPALGTLPLEVLDGVGDVDRAAVDACFAECAVEELAGRADEGTAGAVLLVA